MKLDFSSVGAFVQTHQKNGVTGVAGVTASNHKGLSVTPEKNGGCNRCSKDTIEQAQTPKVLHLLHLEESGGVTAKPAPLLGVTPATPVTPKNTDVCKKSTLPMSIPSDERAEILDWLALIGETDAAVIADTLDRCARDSACREYFVRRSRAEVPSCEAFRLSAGRSLQSTNMEQCNEQ